MTRRMFRSTLLITTALPRFLPPVTYPSTYNLTVTGLVGDLSAGMTVSAKGLPKSRIVAVLDNRGTDGTGVCVLTLEPVR